MGKAIKRMPKGLGRKMNDVETNIKKYGPIVETVWGALIVVGSCLFLMFLA